jgi:hypothetical protein
LNLSLTWLTGEISITFPEISNAISVYSSS